MARRSRLAAGQLHAHADAGVALAAPQSASGPRGARTILERVADGFYRPIERVYMAMLALPVHRRQLEEARARQQQLVRAPARVLPRPPLAGGRRGVADAGLDAGRWSRRCRRASCPRTTRRSSRSTCARPRAPAWPPTQIAAERIAREVREWPEVETTLLTIGDNQQKTPNLAQIYVRLVPPDKRKASQDELQDKVRRELVPKQPKEYRITVSAGGGVRRRHVQHGDRAVHPERARPGPADQVRQADRREG